MTAGELINTEKNVSWFVFSVNVPLRSEQGFTPAVQFPLGGWMKYFSIELWCQWSVLLFGIPIVMRRWRRPRPLKQTTVTMIPTRRPKRRWGITWPTDDDTLTAPRICTDNANVLTQTTLLLHFFISLSTSDLIFFSIWEKSVSNFSLLPVPFRTKWNRPLQAPKWLWVVESTRLCNIDTTNAPAAVPQKACTSPRRTWWPCPAAPPPPTRSSASWTWSWCPSRDR